MVAPRIDSSAGKNARDYSQPAGSYPRSRRQRSTRFVKVPLGAELLNRPRRKPAVAPLAAPTLAPDPALPKTAPPTAPAAEPTAPPTTVLVAVSAVFPWLGEAPASFAKAMQALTSDSAVSAPTCR